MKKWLKIKRFFLLKGSILLRIQEQFQNDFKVKRPYIKM